MNRFHSRQDVLSWGRVIREPQLVVEPSWRDELRGIFEEARSQHLTVLATGLRRSYGDTIFNTGGAVVDMSRLDRFISFDPDRRMVRAESGLSFDSLNEFLLPRGFVVPVSPGTRFVTLGGAVANDIHGKNHHGAGTFGRWVKRLGLLRSSGDEVELTPNDATGLFGATIGGLGLTGIITWVEIEAVPIATAMMITETIAFDDLDAFFALAQESAAKFEYTVAWVDCLATGDRLGRGLFTRANHASDGNSVVRRQTRAGLGVPLDFPDLALNSHSVRFFNALYHWNGRRMAGTRVASYEEFMYPLDSIARWNRIYGKRGMYQYQCVMPSEVAREGMRALLTEIANAGEGSFLVVLKTFGALPSPGLLSFPREGTTLALDFPNRGASTLVLMARLDEIVRAAGGRLYPAKDGRIPAEMFRASYPQWQTFAVHVDPAFSSRFWRRVAE